MQLGPDEVLLTAAVHFKSGMPIEEVERAIDRLEAGVRAANPAIQHIYFESAGLRQGMK
jgi:basic membrane lipoprotein Med (substrate-binding protein (PBP1-ABC) superfamily)